LINECLVIWANINVYMSALLTTDSDTICRKIKD